MQSEKPLYWIKWEGFPPFNEIQELPAFSRQSFDRLKSKLGNQRHFCRSQYMAAILLCSLLAVQQGVKFQLTVFMDEYSFLSLIMSGGFQPFSLWIEKLVAIFLSGLSDIASTKFISTFSLTLSIRLATPVATPKTPAIINKKKKKK